MGVLWGIACCHIRCRCSGKTWAHDSSTSRTSSTSSSSSTSRSSRKMPTSALHAAIAAADLQFNVDAIEMESEKETGTEMETADAVGFAGMFGRDVVCYAVAATEPQSRLA
ncbi:GH17304 [Drosophila grimshawi]|uniref:GH17304 n=1 Tax=Drosophila grimshawi TaxID=7222 RepID=B4JUJ5_DROGR|nr:GH17304 [Drosophila grimshawi]